MKSMCGPKVLCVVVSLDHPAATLQSIFNQTVKPSKVVVAHKSYSQYRYVGERVGRAINHVLSYENLGDYTYLLRVDGDTVLPRDFLEKMLQLNVDLAGYGGYAQLLRMPTFLEAFKGVYPQVFGEDSVVHHTIHELGYNHRGYIVEPIKPASKKYPADVWVQNGVLKYRLGYSLPMVLRSVKDYRSATLVGFNVVFLFAGYCLAYFRRLKKFWFVKEKNGWKRFADLIKSRLA